MIYFRSTRLKIQSDDEVVKLLTQSTTKVLTMFDLVNTSTYLIHEERLFVGQKLNSGEILISRYRHTFFRLFPRIVTKWNIEKEEENYYLVTKNRLGLYSSLALFLILFPMLVGLFKLVTSFNLANAESIGLTLIFLCLFIALTSLEIKFTEKTVRKVINKEKIKNLIAI